MKSEIYGVIAEFKNEAPIIMEAEGKNTSYAAASEFSMNMQQRPKVVRTAIVRLEFVEGNELILADMARLHRAPEDSEKAEVF